MEIQSDGGVVLPPELLAEAMMTGRASAQVVEEVGRHFPESQFKSVIPRSVRLSEAPSYGETILQYAPHSPGAEAYRALALELVRRCDNGHGGTP